VVLVVALAPVGLRALSWRSGHLEVDPEVAQAGAALFNHVFKPGDPLTAGGDGLGPVFNASSCTACHHQGGAGGAGDNERNVTVFTVRSIAGNEPREGVIHARATKPEFKETQALASASVPSQVSQPASGSHCPPSPPRAVAFSQRNTPALFGAKLIEELPEREIVAQERRENIRYGLATSAAENIPVGRALRLADGRIGRFGWKAQTASLADFVQTACANELGLSNPGHAQPQSLARPQYVARGLDLSQQQCDEITAFVASLPRPMEQNPIEATLRERVAHGKKLFTTIGCADCHSPALGAIDGLYSDLLLHRMGPELQGAGSYNDPPVPSPNFVAGEGPQPGEWRTPPLWGVADSAPYLHDGRAGTLDEAIQMHGGQGTAARLRYANRDPGDRDDLIAFLRTLRAPDAK
jgi:CxxC motif-containing protein (DUF1111 family)